MSGHSKDEGLDPGFLRGLAYDLLLERLSRREASDYMCAAADRIERLLSSSAAERAVVEALEARLALAPIASLIEGHD